MAFVPAAPGVPALLTGTSALLSTGLTLLTGDTFSGFGQTGIPQWGIFLNGQPVVLADSVIAFDYKKESTISDYPLEGGQFETYNKVAIPFDARVKFSAGGSQSNRAAFLASIQAIVDDYNLYDVVTPEIVYTSCNIRHHDYQRTSHNGLGLLSVTIWLQQVRVSVGQAGSNTKSASGANQVNGGSVQPIAPTSAQATSAQGFQ